MPVISLVTYNVTNQIKSNHKVSATGRNFGSLCLVHWSVSKQEVALATWARVRMNLQRKVALPKLLIVFGMHWILQEENWQCTGMKTCWLIQETHFGDEEELVGCQVSQSWLTVFGILKLALAAKCKTKYTELISFPLTFNSLGAFKMIVCVSSFFFFSLQAELGRAKMDRDWGESGGMPRPENPRAGSGRVVIFRLVEDSVLK